jgi:hypothetical protein
VVDQFNLEVLGDASAWAIIEPSTISLFPGAEGTARIRFKPPRLPSVLAKPVPFAIRVRSREDARASTVEEGVIEVGPFNDTFAELVPRTARGSYSARSQLALDNRGNTRVNARLTASDPDRKLNFTISPPGLVAEPGTATFARIRLTPRERFFTGRPKTLPYKVFVHQDGQPPIAVDGVVSQQGLLPGWLIPAAAALLALALVLAVLWFTLLRPTIKSFAQPQVLAAASAASAASAAASRAVLAAAAANPGGAASSASGAGGGSNPFHGLPTDHHMGASAGSAYDPGGILSLTDVIFENPDGNSGTITLYRVHLPSGTPEGQAAIPSGAAKDLLMVMRLDNFRDLDFHFVSPIIVQKDEGLQLSCTGSNGKAISCTASLYYSGYLTSS